MVEYEDTIQADLSAQDYEAHTRALMLDVQKLARLYLFAKEAEGRGDYLRACGE